MTLSPVQWTITFLFGGFLVLSVLHQVPALSQQQDINPTNLSGSFDQSETTAYYNNARISLPVFSQRRVTPQTAVLGLTDAPKKILVDLTNQRLYAYEGDRLVFDYLVSTGKWGRTPTGTFNIWVKLRYTKMSGGSKALGTYYYLPNVPYTMFFYNDEIPKSRGFGIHGTYWHNNFGHPMSHGCVNMKTEEIEQLYYWADPVLGEKQSIYATKDNPGTPVIIYGVAPES